jgi:hypothetical protein
MCNRPSAVRNDRNKKRKAKEEGCSSSTQHQVEELTSDDQDIIERITTAHEHTFPLILEDEKIKLV